MSTVIDNLKKITLLLEPDDHPDIVVALVQAQDYIARLEAQVAALKADKIGSE